MKRIGIPDSDLSVSSLCLGTMGLLTVEQAEPIVALFLEAGGNFIDTAHCYSFWTPYGSGASERSVAEAVRRLGARDRVVIATKGGHPSEPGYRTVDRYLSPARVEADIDDSLGRLGTDCIELYWLHRDDLRVPVPEIVDALNREVERGRIRHLGASNWSVERIGEANEYARLHGLRGFVASQPGYSLAAPPPEARRQRYLFRPQEIAWHTATGFPVVAYSPTARGYFATGGRSGDRYASPGNASRLRRVEGLAASRGVTPNQIALAYLMGQPFPVIPIVGSTDPEHLRDALGAEAVALAERELRLLDAE